jgi:hypothetical protein
MGNSLSNSDSSEDKDQKLENIIIEDFKYYAKIWLGLYCFIYVIIIIIILVLNSGESVKSTKIKHKPIYIDRPVYLPTQAVQPINYPLPNQIPRSIPNIPRPRANITSSDLNLDTDFTE